MTGFWLCFSLLLLFVHCPSLPAGGESPAAVRPAPGVWAGCMGLLRHKRAWRAHVGADAVCQKQCNLLGAFHRSVCRVSGVGCLQIDMTWSAWTKVAAQGHLSCVCGYGSNRAKDCMPIDWCFCRLHTTAPYLCSIHARQQSAESRWTAFKVWANTAAWPLCSRLQYQP